MTQKNDGKEEKGALRVDQTQLMSGEGFSFSGYERDPLYLNLGTKKFMDISGVSGIDSITDGRAGVFADFDNDGDLDVFSTTIQGQSHLLFRNNVGQANNWLRVALEGSGRTGRDAFSAVVRVKTSAGTLTKIKDGGSGFISQHDPRLLFGLGKDTSAEWIEVTWPHGKTERFAGDARAGATLLLREGTGRAETVAVNPTKLPDPLTRAEAFAQGLKIRIGQPMPELALKPLGRVATSLRKQLKPGRRALVNVWATWCTPCAAEMPELEKLRAPLAARGIDLMGLNVDSDPAADVGGFIKMHRVQYPNYLGGVRAIESLYATDELSVPMSIVVDERGVVTEIIPGWSAETRKRFGVLAGEGEGVGSNGVVGASDTTVTKTRPRTNRR
ncbi:MAG: enediyne biosynthesis protein [Pyrinomonadaceae bacterium]|nr:enediyne biosynthesis protein [Pyrinomonadaceae bacterium]